jgi:hypothetical protein
MVNAVNHLKLLPNLICNLSSLIFAETSNPSHHDPSKSLHRTIYVEWRLWIECLIVEFPPPIWRWCGMNGAAWLLVAATLGVDFGWQYAPDGKLEYLIQIPDSQYETLRNNAEGTVSNIPPEVLPHIRRFRILVGNQQLPQEKLPAPVGGVRSERTPFGNDPINAQAVGMQALGENATPFVPGAPESSVQPLDKNAPLPGPGYDDPHAAVDNTLLSLPNMRSANPNFSDYETQPTSSFGTIIPTVPTIPRNLKNPQHNYFPPQTTPPGMYNTQPNPYAGKRFGEPHFGSVNTEFPAEQQAAYNANANSALPYNTNNTGGYNNDSRFRSAGNTPVQQLAPASYAMVIIGLCLSIGANMFLGWLAWEYYLRYRESFETWRNSSR